MSKKIYTQEKLINDARIIFDNYHILSNKAINDAHKKLGTSPAFAYEKYFNCRREVYSAIGEKDPKFLSFYDWCIQNNCQYFIDQWDYELNTIDVQELHAHSNQKFYFKCDRNLHDSFLVEPNELTNGKPLRCKKCLSVAQLLIDKYGENALDIFWNYELNDKSPWEIPANANYKVYLNCKDVNYHRGGKILTYHIAKNNCICSFCNLNQVHPLDSIGQFLIDSFGENAINDYWSNKNTVSPFEIYKKSGIKVWIKCVECNYHNDYEKSCYNFYIGQRCPECVHKKVNKFDSVGYKHPKIFDVWSDKNILSPFDFFQTSNKEAWFKCKNNIHKDFKRSISVSFRYDFRCPDCSRDRIESMIQEKARKYLENKYSNYTILHEYDCTLYPINPETGARLRYDLEIKELKIIIEIHGKQHYEICGYHLLESKRLGISPEEVYLISKKRDEFKQKYAIDNGYNYLIISYKDIQKNDRYQKIIDDYIENIVLNEQKEAI